MPSGTNFFRSLRRKDSGIPAQLSGEVPPWIDATPSEHWPSNDLIGQLAQIRGFGSEVLLLQNRLRDNEVFIQNTSGDFTTSPSFAGTTAAEGLAELHERAEEVEEVAEPVHPALEKPISKPAPIVSTDGTHEAVVSPELHGISSVRSNRGPGQYAEALAFLAREDPDPSNVREPPAPMRKRSSANLANFKEFGSMRRLDTHSDPTGNARQKHRKASTSPTDDYISPFKKFSKSKLLVTHTEPPAGLVEAIIEAKVEYYPLHSQSVHREVCRNCNQEANLKEAVRSLLRIERRLSQTIPEFGEIREAMADVDSKYVPCRPTNIEMTSWCPTTVLWEQLEIFNSHFCYLLISPWPVSGHGDKYLWDHTGRCLPEMGDAALKHWLYSQVVNQKVCATRVRRALDALIPALQGMDGMESGISRLNLIKGHATVDTTPMQKQLCKTEEVWLEYALAEIGDTLDSVMKGTCFDHPGCKV